MMTIHARARALVAAAAVALLTAMVGVVAAPAAQAAPPEILVSDDGVTFTPSLTDGLFDGLGELVPLESISTSVWVRNTSSTNGSLRLTVDDFVQPSQEFAENVTITADAGPYSWTLSLADLETCGTIVPTLAIAAGATVRINLTAEMGNLTGQDAQAEAADMDLTVYVRDAASPFPSARCEQPGEGGPTDPTDPDNPGGGSDNSGGSDNNAGGDDSSLSHTGADVARTLAIGLLLAVTGFIIVFARRRRSDEDEA